MALTTQLFLQEKTKDGGAQIGREGYPCQCADILPVYCFTDKGSAVEPEAL